MAKTTKSKINAEVENSGFDLNELERLVEFMQKHNLEEVEYERGHVRMALKKASPRQELAQRTYLPMEAGAPMMMQPMAAPVGPAYPPAAPAPEQRAEKALSEDLHEVKSPIVGTFYASPSPDAQSFVKIGDKVEVGQVLCIVEAMKLMNEIESDVAGEVAQIFIENGSPVEYGQPLFGIRSSGRKK